MAPAHAPATASLAEVCPFLADCGGLCPLDTDDDDVDGGAQASERDEDSAGIADDGTGIDALVMTSIVAVYVHLTALPAVYRRVFRGRSS